MYEITRFAGTEAAQTRSGVRHVEPDIAGLAEVISQSMWAPGLFRGDIRANANLESVALLTLDFDSGLQLDRALEIFSGYRHIIGTSKSHGIEKNGVVCDRFRVVLFLEAPATTDAAFKEYWFAAFSKWPEMDKACKDSARFFFPCTQIVSVNEDGALFSDRLVIEAPRQPQLATRQLATRKGKLSDKTEQFLIYGDDTPNGEWHEALFKACMDFKEKHYSIDEARMKLMRVTNEWDSHDEQTLTDVFENRIPKYPVRESAIARQALIELISKSKYVINMANTGESVLIDESTGITLDIRQQVLASLIGKEDIGLYFYNNVIYAKFEYDRFKYSPLFLDPVSGIHVYNSYVPPAWQHDFFYFSKPLPTSSELPPIYDEFFNHLTAGDMESKAYIIDWLATAMRSRNYTILTAIGDQGIGKGVLGALMEKLFGEHNYVRTRDEIFKNKFNGQLKNKVLVYIDEVALKSAEDHNRLKDIVNDKIEIERKGFDAIYVKNFASYYLSSNHLDAVRPEAGDRRFSIIQLTDRKLGATPLISRLEEMNSAENIAKLAAFLLNHKVTRDMTVPFISERSKEVREAGLADWEAFVVFDWTSDKVGRSFDLTKLQADIVIRFGSFRSPPGRRRIEDLAKKYPEYLKIQRKSSDTAERLIEVLSSPTANVLKLNKGWPTLTGKGS
jgi:hypothetical protein